MPGDRLLDGTALGAIHTRGGEHRQRIYTFFSVRYSELDIYTSPVMFEGLPVKMVLQCRQRPGYEVGGETVGWERRHLGNAISSYFANALVFEAVKCDGSTFSVLHSFLAQVEH